MSGVEFHQLEAVLFAAASPLSMDTLSDIFEVYIPEIEDVVAAYEELLIRERRGIRIRRSAAGIELVSASARFVIVMRNYLEPLWKHWL